MCFIALNRLKALDLYHGSTKICECDEQYVKAALLIADYKFCILVSET